MTDPLQQDLITIIAKELNVSPENIDPDVPLIRYNLDSFSLFNLKYTIEQKYAVTLFKNYPIEEVTVNKMLSEIRQP